MNDEPSTKVANSSRQPQSPWWEPYLLTTGVLAAFAFVLIAFGYLASIPYIQPMLFILATIAAVVATIKAPSALPTIVDKILYSGFFALASVAYFSKAEMRLAFGFTGMACVWVCLAIHACVIQRARRRDQLAKLDRAVETLHRALRDD